MLLMHDVLPIVHMLHMVWLFQILMTVRRFRAVLITSVSTWSMAIRVHVQLVMSWTILALSA